MSAVFLVLPLMNLLFSAVFGIMLHAVEVCPRRIISTDCEGEGNYWKFGDALIYVAGKLLFLDFSPTVRLHAVNGTLVEHALRPTNPIGTMVDFIISMGALIFLGGAIGFFCEMEVIEHMIRLFSCGQHHRKTIVDNRPSVSLACELFAAGAYCFLVVPLFVAVSAVPFGAIIAACEGWQFVDGYRYLVGIMIQFPSLSNPKFRYHTLGSKIALFIIGNWTFSMVNALTLALIVELPLLKKMSRLYETRLCKCGRGDIDVHSPKTDDLENPVDKNNDQTENLLSDDEQKLSEDYDTTESSLANEYKDSDN